MRIEQALNKIAELGQQLMLDPNPEVAHVGAAVPQRHEPDDLELSVRAHFVELIV